ncbi:MAG TPA: hypothetical protein VGT02_15535 [Methylomirabilota bacterium]|nr:hypothetical protein [Methylomirabilota bacterium]
MIPRVSRPLGTWILGILLLPLLFAGAAMVHTHDGPGLGLYNQEHDRTFYAVAGAAALTAAATAVLVVVLATPLVVSAARRAEALPCAGADSRAPPVR